jgi:hypothetical protein
MPLPTDDTTESTQKVYIGKKWQKIKI